MALDHRSVTRPCPRTPSGLGERSEEAKKMLEGNRTVPTSYHLLAAQATHLSEPLFLVSLTVHMLTLGGIRA